jgi:thiosulfate reductase cytochrome b subunit
MYYSGPENQIIPFVSSVKMHNICGIGLSLNYFIFFIGNMVSGNGKYYKIRLKGLASAVNFQLKYYLHGYFRKGKTSFPSTENRKFDPLQAISYSLVMYTGVPLLILTGWCLLFPETIPGRISGVSGILLTDLLHVITGFLLSIFMFVHIYMCTIGTRPGSNFRAILTGWQTIEKE